MSDNETAVVHGASDGGVVGKHADPDPFQFLVGPSTSDELNTARLRLIPIACWRVDDIRFAFDSSFVTPEITAELQMLVGLRETFKKKNAATGETVYPPLSVFGHADPVGTDDYNKALSGRRATAVYAILISHSEPDKAVALWRDIAASESWGANQRQKMRTIVPSETSDGDLVKTYMQKLRPPELQLGVKDFLAQGAGGGGQGDYQGCSEFNPLIIFSRNQETEFEQASDKTARNLANAPNRRVLVLLFMPGSKINPSKWPCPNAKDGKTACIRRFWSDGESRRSTHLPDQPRSFQQTQDTFACRFYQRLTNNSPCDGVYSRIRIRLLDAFSKPIPNAPYRIELPSRTSKGHADKDGWLQEIVANVPAKCHVDWGYPDANENPSASDIGTATPIPIDSLYQMDVLLQVSETAQMDADDEALSNKLNNLGYSWGQNLKDNIVAFQLDHRRPEGLTGNPADVQGIVSQWHDSGDTGSVPIRRSITLYGKFPDDGDKPS